MSAEPASRVTDGFGHSNALTGALVGLAVGVGVGLLIIGTGGLGAIAVGAAIGIAGGAGLAGEAIGSTMPGPVTGNIQTGSPNVVVNGLPMAAVQIGAGPCSHHSGTQLVASGAASVLVNGQPAARIRELMTCSAAIRTGSPNVVIGGPSKQVLQTAPEVPRLLHNTMLAMAIGGAIIGTGGIAATYGTGAAVGSVVGGIGGGMLGSAGARQGAAALGFGATGQEVAAQLGGFAGGALFGGMGMRGGQAAQARIPAGKFGLSSPNAAGGGAPVISASSAAAAKPRLTRSDLTDYLSNVSTKTHGTIASDLQGAGLRMKGQSPDGRFMSFVDKSGRLRAQLHPADKVTTSPHLHIYDAKGNPLDVNLNRVSRTSPDAHIITGGY